MDFGKSGALALLIMFVFGTVDALLGIASPPFMEWITVWMLLTMMIHTFTK